MPRRKLHGFTVIELLTVVAVIAVLMSLLLPAVGKARNQAKTVKCSSNLRQLAIAFQMYAADWNDTIMPVGTWNTADTTNVAPYWFERCTDYFKYAAKSDNSTADILRCPTAVEQLIPMTKSSGKDKKRYSLNGNVCTLYMPARKFGSLQRVVLLAGDGMAEHNGDGTWGIWERMDEGWKPWPFMYPFLGGHNNAHLANMLFSDLHVELRNKNPKTAEWKDY